MSTTIRGGEGWMCAVCHQWVPQGCTHFCQQTWQPQPARTMPAPVDPLARVAEALERIAAALEKAATSNTEDKT